MNQLKTRPAREKKGSFLFVSYSTLPLPPHIITYPLLALVDFEREKEKIGGEEKTW